MYLISHSLIAKSLERNKTLHEFAIVPREHLVEILQQAFRNNYHLRTLQGVPNATLRAEKKSACESLLGLKRFRKSGNRVLTELNTDLILQICKYIFTL